MSRVCCLARISPLRLPTLGAALRGAGVTVFTAAADLNVANLAALAPDLLLADVDGLESAALEALRRLRFVLPDCIVVVYTALEEPGWSRSCHLAGASAVLSQNSDEALLTAGLQLAIKNGCFTDPHLAA